MENNKFLKVTMQNHTFYSFDDVIIFEGCDFDNILLDKNSDQNILIYDIS